MDLTDLTTTEGLIALAVVVAVLVALVVGLTLLLRRRRARRAHLQRRFGDEYDRTVERTGSQRRADAELAELEERRASFDIRPLSPGPRDRFRARWEDLQASFVDAPEAAVRHADQLLDEVAEARGYPDEPREQRLEDLSVDHARAVERYRSVHDRLHADDGRADTEQLRSALLASRGLFEALVGRADPSRATPRPPFRDIVRDDDGAASGEEAERTAQVVHEPSGNGIPQR